MGKWSGVLPQGCPYFKSFSLKVLSLPNIPPLQFPITPLLRSPTPFTLFSAPSRRLPAARQTAWA
jgi:hypothetical protein